MPGTVLAAVILVCAFACSGSEGSRFVTVVSRVLEHLAAATEVVDVLDSACTVFEDLLTLLRRHQEDEVCAFPAFVLAACAAANGRDATGGVWKQLPEVSMQDVDDEPPLNCAAVAEIAVAVAAASDGLAARLSACALSAANEEDRACCERAAAEAARIRTLMGGVSPP